MFIDKNIILPSNKKFGIFFSLIFLIFFLYFLYKFTWSNAYYFFLALSLAFLIVSLFKDNILYPLNLFWYYLGYYLGKIISPIIIGFIYYILISPLGLFLKVIGRDILI